MSPPATLPFSAAQFFDVFVRYNIAVWPAQLLLVGGGVGLAALAWSGRPQAGRIVSLGLALLWLWMGVVYHLVFFRAVNPAAALFGIVFVAEAALLLWLGAWRGRVGFARGRGWGGGLGLLLVVYALVIYPALGFLAGHRYPAMPSFGLPCPTTILTLGLVVWSTGPSRLVVALIPLAWAAIGTSAALTLGVIEDLGLGVAAVLTIYWLWRTRHGGAVGGSPNTATEDPCRHDSAHWRQPRWVSGSRV
jgi:hypothetical protein